MTRLSKIQAKIAFSFCTLFSLYFPVAFSQQVDTAWVRRYNGPGNGDDKAVALAVDDSGNVYVTGSSFDSTTGYDYCTIKYLPDGDTGWVRRYNGSSNWDDFASALELDNDGNIYVTGRSNGDFATIKYNPVGQQLWAKRVNFLFKDAINGAYALVIDGNGNVYVTGRILDNEFLLLWVTVKYDSQGNELWNRFDEHTPAGTAFAMAIDSSGNVYVTNSIGTIKYDSLGNKLWFRSFSGVALAIALDKDGNVYVVGADDSNFIVIKYDTSGDSLWVRRSNSRSEEWQGASFVTTDKNYNVYVVGNYSSIPDDVAWTIIKYDSAGNQLWYQAYRGINFGQPREPKAIVLDSAGNIYITGYDAWYAATIKYDPGGNLLWEKRYGWNFDYSSTGNDIAVGRKGNVFVTGSTESDFLTIKYSPIPQLKGDLNLDGILNSFDVVLSINCTFLGEAPPAAPAACDINCDGKVSPADVVILLLMVFASASAPC